MKYKQSTIVATCSARNCFPSKGRSILPASCTTATAAAAQTTTHQQCGCGWHVTRPVALDSICIFYFNTVSCSSTLFQIFWRVLSSHHPCFKYSNYGLYKGLDVLPTCVSTSHGWLALLAEVVLLLYQLVAQDCYIQPTTFRMRCSIHFLVKSNPSFQYSPCSFIILQYRPRSESTPTTRNPTQTRVVARTSKTPT